MPRLNRTGGFTLLEIVLVVLILAILATVAAPVIGRVVGKAGIKAEALKLCEDIRYAQHSALSEGQYFQLALNKSTGAYRVYPLADGADIRKDVEMGDNVTGISATFPVDADDTDITYITYLSTGSPSVAGTITLSESSGGTISVIVALGTGRVRVE
jgi:prepilin-type N-terminal cleavage/methylation domain-containing protein